jgi:EAL and modified HD-GYP domain-containing signal transduction protein
MEFYLGRQPILDRGWNVAAYQLLFHSSEAHFRDSADGVSATEQAIVNAVLGVGMERLLGGKPAFIRLTRQLLLGGGIAVLPPDKVVIEIQASVAPDAAILSACIELRRQGYALALQNCLDDGRTEAFAPFMDILKIDFQQTSRAEQRRIVGRYKKPSTGVVAEKVETEAEFQTASRLGCDYFQGFFFVSPTVLRTERVPVSQATGMRLVKQIQRKDLDFDAIEQLIRHDLSFSHSLLKFLNSAAFHWAVRVESIHQGLVLLGSDEIRKWAWMATVSSLVQHRPPVLMAQVLMRGRLSETIAGFAKLPLGDSDPFLVGMFSLLDAILQRPLDAILGELNIGPKIRNALLGAGGEADLLSLVLRIVKSYEVGDWQGVQSAAQVIGLSAEELNTCYLESLAWVETVFSYDEQKWTAASSPASMDFHRNPEARAALTC